MNWTITIGSWVIPALVTAVVLVWFVVVGSRPTQSRGYATIGEGMVFIVQGASALIVSLIAWLIWAVLT